MAPVRLDSDVGRPEHLFDRVLRHRVVCLGDAGSGTANGTVLRQWAYARRPGGDEPGVAVPGDQ